MAGVHASETLEHELNVRLATGAQQVHFQAFLESAAGDRAQTEIWTFARSGIRVSANVTFLLLQTLYNPEL